MSLEETNAIVHDMEKTLNSRGIWNLIQGEKRFTRISTNQYWDWLTYIDVSSLIDITGRLPHRVGSHENKVALLLAAQRDRSSRNRNRFLLLDVDLPNPWQNSSSAQLRILH